MLVEEHIWLTFKIQMVKKKTTITATKNNAKQVTFEQIVLKRQ